MRPNIHESRTMHLLAFFRLFSCEKLLFLEARPSGSACCVTARPSEARPSGSALISPSAWLSFSPWLALFALLSLSACGYVGNPQAPTLDIPQQINDLRFVQYGDKIR